jgi:hypothetical protein
MERALTTRKPGAEMSNIPFNAVASIVASVNAQSANAAPQSRKLQESARIQRAQQLKDQQRSEEVDDPGEHSITNVRDENQPNGQQSKKKKHNDNVDVLELTQEDGTVTQVQSTPTSLPSIRNLDISA